MPDVAAGLQGGVFPKVGGNFDAFQNPFGCSNLIGPHDQKLLFGGEDAVFRQNGEKRMFREEGFPEIHQIEDRTIPGVRPPGGKFKAVAGSFPLVCSFAVSFPDMVVPGGVAVIFCQCPVGDDEDLDIFKESAPGPEGFAGIPVDLVERLAEIDAAAFQFDVDEREPVDQDGHIVTVFAGTVLGGILVDDLKFIVMNILLVEEMDVFDGTVRASEVLNGVILDDGGFLTDPMVRVGNEFLEEAFPLDIGEGDVVQGFELFPEIGNEFRFGCDGQIFVCLGLQQLDECLFEIGFGLIGGGAGGIGSLILPDDGAFGILGNNIILAHGYASFAIGLKVRSLSR